MSDLRIDLEVALAFEAKPTERAYCLYISPLGHWKYNELDAQCIGSEVGWQPVPATSAQVWTKCLEWLLDAGWEITLIKDERKTRLYWERGLESRQFVGPADTIGAVIACFMKAKGKS